MTKRWLPVLLMGLMVPVLAFELYGISADKLAIWAAPVEMDDTFVSWRTDVPMSPASTMKLVTAWAALNNLGPDYVWRTDLVSIAPIENGVLKGDLFWVGRGDPRFDLDSLRGLAAQLRARGVRKIQGRLLLDKTYFNRIATAEGFEHDKGRAFMCAPDTHLTNLNRAWLTFFNDANGPRAAIQPLLADVQLGTFLQSSELVECKDVRHHVRLTQTYKRITVSGKLPLACDNTRNFVEQLMPVERFAGEAFRAAWRDLGGSGPEGVGNQPAPAQARVLAFWQSDPLSYVLPDIMKYSSNPMARLLYLTLGREALVSGDVVIGAQTVVRQTLRAHGLDDQTLILENGSGLSRSERLSAKLLGEILIDAARSPYAAEFISSLPIAGEKGTLQQRFANIGPRLRLKTGSLDGVRALAGYWQATDGRRLAIVVMVNQPDAAERLEALDAIVSDLIQRFTSTQLSPKKAMNKQTSSTKER